MTRIPIMLGDKQAKCNVKFPCKLCKDDHLTYLCPRIDEASRFLTQVPTVLTNPLPHNQNMNSRTHDQYGGDQDPSEGSVHGCINMVHATKVVTHTKDYGSSQPDPGKEPDPPGTPLCIEKPVDKPEAAPHIPRESLSIQGTILMLEPPRTILLLRIWATLLMQFLH